MLVVVPPSLLVLAASHHNAVVLMKLVLGQTGRLAKGVVLWYIVILYSRSDSLLLHACTGGNGT